MPPYKLSPSDLTFAWEECKYCFYMKVKYGVVVRTPFPSIFGRMANLTSAFYQGRSTEEISPSLPPGVITYREKTVKSAPILLPGTDAQCYISGRFDAVIRFLDGTYGIIDYKTSDAKDEQAAFYSRQLTAYAYALENPASGALFLSPVSRMGLFVITPDRYEPTPSGEIAYINSRAWVEIPRNDLAFLAFLQEVVALLENPDPPPPSDNCGICSYRKSMQELFHGSPP